MENGNLYLGLDQYKIYLKQKKQVSKATLSAYNTDLNNFLTYLEKKYQLSHCDLLNQTILMSYVLHMKDKGRASSTISRSVSAIKNFMLFLFHEGYIFDNLSEGKLDLPKERKKLPEVLSVDEVNQIMSKPEATTLGLRDKAMLEVLYASGLKINELIDLSIEDVDMKFKVIRCINKKSERVLPIGAMAYDALALYLKNSRDELNKKSIKYLFLSYNGERMTRQGFWKIVKKYVDQAGIDKSISTSTFRHSFATHMIENGIHKETLKNALGNASVASVQKYLDLNRKRVK
jgi:integrase/recombinase XerD